MREKFKEILEKHGIYGEDPEEILYAVEDMLEFVANETRREEPYAINSIDRLEKAAYEVFNLASDI